MLEKERDQKFKTKIKEIVHYFGRLTLLSCLQAKYEARPRYG